MNTIKTDKKEQMKKNIKAVNKTLCGVCIGALAVGVITAIKMNKKNARISDLSETTRDLFKIIEMQHSIYEENADLKQEVQIRDCMVMEGIDGDAEIYSRRMQHFRDFKIETGELGQKKRDSEIYCSLAAMDADDAYADYLCFYQSEYSEIPPIPEDDELPF